MPITSIKKYINDDLSSGSKTEYTMWKGHLVPKTIYEFYNDENITIPIRQYISYTDNFLVNSYIDECGVTHKLQWNKYNQLIASIANCSEEVTQNEDINKFMDLNRNSVFTSKPNLTNLYDYDNRGRLSVSIDQNKRKTEFYYDKFNRLSAISMYDEKKMDYSYNYAHKKDSLVASYGIYTKNILHTAEAYMKDVKIDYQLKYDITNAELRLVHTVSGDIEDIVKIPNYSKKGTIHLKAKYADGGACIIWLYANGKYICQADSRVNFYPIPN